MANSPTPNPNPNRRRRLTADELIAIGVALAGIGTVFFWGIGQKYRPMDLLQGGTATSGTNNNTTGKIGLLGEDAGQQKTIASVATQANPDAASTTTNPVAPAVKTVATVPAASTAAAPAGQTVPPIAAAPAEIVPAVVPTTVPATPTPVSTTPAFTDVPKKFWGETYITELQKRGVLDDFGTGKFDPTKEITRGEYAKMLDRAFADKPLTAVTASFKDVPTDYPRKEAVDKSVQLGFMSGYSPTKFAPNQVIPRYQLQISLAKGLNLPVPSSSDTVLSKFTDAQQMPKYAREKMASAVDAGLTIKDKTTNLLKPVQNATRADAAALIYEVLVKEGKIKPAQ
jgi:S-layer homology domain